ncbi:MAG TPA: iron-sulfur cluster repair di-iron protein [Tepidisphaeraceae bacterium]|jgi:regulator of cell morphogenesis and NO signaling
MSVTLEATVGQLVVERPGRARVFENLGIDYCCGGKKPLGEACRDKGLDPQQLLAEIQAADTTTSESGRNWAAATITELADHIQSTHHALLKAEFPRLDRLTDKVATVHGQRHPDLLAVRATFVEFKEELEAHMMKEERILFPLCRQIDSGDAMESHCGSVANPIRMMMLEHDHAGAAMEKMRALTNGYVPPADACNTYRAMLDGLAVIEADMHQHVHKENNILFPRAIAAEDGLSR